MDANSCGMLVLMGLCPGRFGGMNSNEQIVHMRERCVAALKFQQPTMILLGWDKGKWDKVCGQLGIDFDVSLAFREHDEAIEGALMMPVCGVRDTSTTYVKKALDIWMQWAMAGNSV